MLLVYSGFHTMSTTNDIFREWKLHIRKRHDIIKQYYEGVF